MLRMLFALVLITAGALSVACNAFSSATGDNPPAPAGNPVSNPVPRGTDPPVGACNSRLGGKITNAATNQGAPNTAVEVKLGSRVMKTTTDNNGLYAFAGLCAGEYTMTITPPGRGPIENPNKVVLSGTQAVKLDLPYQ